MENGAYRDDDRSVFKFFDSFELFCAKLIISHENRKTSFHETSFHDETPAKKEENYAYR